MFTWELMYERIRGFALCRQRNSPNREPLGLSRFISPRAGSNEVNQMFGRPPGALAVIIIATGLFLETKAPAQSGVPISDTSALHGPSFVPDSTFRGSTLSGWHTLGHAVWSAENGEIIGKAVDSDGWLVLDRSMQDTGFYSAFQCIGGLRYRCAAPDDEDRGWNDGYLLLR